MNSFGQVENALEDIYEQGGYVNIDSNTIVNGDLQVTGNFSSGSGGAGTSIKIENNTGKIEIVSGTKIETKLNNTLVLENEAKTVSTGGVVFTTHFHADSFFLEELIYNVQHQYPFVALMDATSIIKIGIDMSYVGSPTIKVSIFDTGGIQHATVTTQLPTLGSLTETTYPFT